MNGMKKMGAAYLVGALFLAGCSDDILHPEGTPYETHSASEETAPQAELPDMDIPKDVETEALEPASDDETVLDTTGKMGSILATKSAIVELAKRIVRNGTTVAVHVSVPADATGVLASNVSQVYNKDDDAGLKVLRVDFDTFNLVAEGGNAGTWFGVWFSAVRGVRVYERLLELHGEETVVATVRIPAGRDAAGFISLERSWPFGEDDPSFMARVYSAGDVLVFVAKQTRGRRSLVRFRCNVLSWPRGVAKAWTRRFTLRANGSYSLAAPQSGLDLQASITGNISDGQPNLFNDIDSQVERDVVRVLGVPYVNRHGLSDSRTATRVLTPDQVYKFAQIVKTAWDVGWGLRGLFGNPYDDDASTLVRRTAGGILVRIYDGNSRSMTQVDILQICLLR